jgi:hypothetical protein
MRLFESHAPSPYHDRESKAERGTRPKGRDNALITTLSRAANSDILYQDTPPST